MLVPSSGIPYHAIFADEKALRDEDHGAWGVEEFVLCAELYSHEKDVIAIFEKVSQCRIKLPFELNKFKCRFQEHWYLFITATMKGFEF